MLRSFIITITLENIEYNIFVSPFSLHSKKRPEVKSGKIEKLFFYNNLKDADYVTNLIQQNFIDQEYNSEKYIINYGQDFEKYYIGSFHVDVDKKLFWQWEGNSNKFNEQDVKVLADSLFNHNSNHKSIIMFTPTNPSDINLSVGSIDFE